MTMDNDFFAKLFTQKKLDELFPANRADQFFEALLGDADEGAYDIMLRFGKFDAGRLEFELQLHQRPRKCLACNLTYGLPNVFSRHPIINVPGLVDQICKLLNGNGRCAEWSLGNTREISRQLHVVPLIIHIEK